MSDVQVVQTPVSAHAAAREPALVFLAMPTYLNRIEDAGVVIAILRAAHNNKVGHSFVSSSANCFGFNKLWCDALNARPKFTHFLMLHSDIVPLTDHFVDKMIEIMERENADVVSAVSPIKDHHGFTSTALDEKVGDMDQRWRVRRLTLKEIFKRPPTWTEPNLLLNTGLMLVDIRKPWVDKMHFHFEDEIIIDSKGQRRPVMFPEDWNFSRDAARLGAKLVATREVKLRHVGPASYVNMGPWGECDTDIVIEESPELKRALNAMEKVDGWMTREEGGHLYETGHEAVTKISPVVVEIGSWKGRSTVALAAMAKIRKAKVYAIDPHEGDLWSNGQVIKTDGTLESLKKTLETYSLTDAVEIVQKKSTDVEWSGVLPKIGLLFIDGKHDYESVKADFEHFEKHLASNALVAFHDYNEDGVKLAVDEILANKNFEARSEVGSLKVIRHVDPGDRAA